MCKISLHICGATSPAGLVQGSRTGVGSVTVLVAVTVTVAGVIERHEHALETLDAAY